MKYGGGRWLEVVFHAWLLVKLRARAYVHAFMWMIVQEIVDSLGKVRKYRPKGATPYRTTKILFCVNGSSRDLLMDTN